MKNDFPHCPTCKLGGYDRKPQEGDTFCSRNLTRFSEQFNWFVQNAHPNTEVKQDEIMSLPGSGGSLASLKIISLYHTKASDGKKRIIF